MAPMGIRLSPLGVAVFCLLGVGVIYHLYSGVISSRLAAFRQRRTVDLRDLLAVSVEAAELGGKEVKQVREENVLQEKSKGKTKEGANDPFTMGDLQSHRKMFYLLKNTFPEVTVSPDFFTSPERVIFKHDFLSVSVLSSFCLFAHLSTENLVKYVTTMVCVAVDGKPVIGVVHQPFAGFTAWAVVGHGSNVNRRSSYNASPKKVIVSRSHSGKVKNYIRNAFGNSTTIIEAGGAGYKVLSLLDTHSSETSLTEEADVYVHTTVIKKWDICAGAALLTELGGQMTTLKGENIDYRGTPVNEGGLVASVGIDHEALLKRLPGNTDNDKQ
uniref:inositol-phosphate phosphatase n=1 Tax=Neolamprologus brichardi TaxID=32507 RepID=A0A3Q4FZ26_NEOBR